MQLERYIGMSVTPKSHIIEDHACEQQERLLGIGDLDESFGERNHQIETRFDSKYGRLRDFKLREKFKAKEQASANYKPVRDRILQIKKKRHDRNIHKNITDKKQSKTQEDARQRRLDRLREREDVNNYIVPTQRLISIRETLKNL